MTNFKLIAIPLPVNQYIQTVKVYASDTGTPPIGPFYYGLRYARVDRYAIGGQWEEYRSHLRAMLQQPVNADVTFNGSELTGGAKLEGKDPEAVFRARLDFEKALWDLVSGINILDPARDRAESEPVELIHLQKTGPVIRLTRGSRRNAPQFIITSNDPYLGSSLDICTLRLNSWLQIEKWAGGEDIRALLTLSFLIHAYPFAILFEDPSKMESMTLSRFAAFWSTHPRKRFDELTQLLRKKTLPPGALKEPFWQALVGAYKTPAEANFFQLRNPVLVWLGME